MTAVLQCNVFQIKSKGIYDNGSRMCPFEPQAHMYALLHFVIDHTLIILPRNQNRPDPAWCLLTGTAAFRKSKKFWNSMRMTERDGVRNALQVELRTNDQKSVSQWLLILLTKCYNKYGQVEPKLLPSNLFVVIDSNTQVFHCQECVCGKSTIALRDLTPSADIRDQAKGCDWSKT